MSDAQRYPLAEPGLDASELLDRQVIDAAGEFAGNVDDLEVTERDGRLFVEAILTGPDVVGHRLGGRLGTWVSAIWRRLHPAGDPVPGRIEWSEVVELDSAVHVRSTRKDLANEGFEDWLKRYLIDRIPGSRHE